MVYAVGQRVIVTREEYEQEYIDAGVDIPVGTTGTVCGTHDSEMSDPVTGELTAAIDIVFDIPFPEEGNRYWNNDGGLVRWQILESMIEPYEGDRSEEDWTPETVETGFSCFLAG